MRLIWINIVAIVIAISSLVVERPSVLVDYGSADSISQIPHFSLEVFRNDHQQHQKKHQQIAQDFIPIVVIAIEPDANHGFIHYLPLYDLNRRNPHFLLI